MKPKDRQKKLRYYYRRRERDYFENCRYSCQKFYTEPMSYQIGCRDKLYSPATIELAQSVGSQLLCSKSRFFKKITGAESVTVQLLDNKKVNRGSKLEIETMAKLARLFRKEK